MTKRDKLIMDFKIFKDGRWGGMKKKSTKTVKFTVVKQGKEIHDSDLIYSCCRKSQRTVGPPGNQ